MKAELLDFTRVTCVMDSIRECYDSFGQGDDGGPKDQKLVKKIIKSGHTSTLEHAVYHLKLSGFSRAVLQELSRHRMSSPSVRSTRYTLKKVLKSDANLQDLMVQTGVMEIDMLNLATMVRLKSIMLNNPNMKNDVLKYALPEALKVDERLTINARSLRNFLNLRLSKRALWEIRDLAGMIYNVIPDDHKVLFFDIEGKYYDEEGNRF